MKLKREDCVLYAVTDRRWTKDKTLARQVEEALKGGATMIQLREKELGEIAFETEALEIQSICRKYGVPFLINDNVALAKKINADGVHVGQGDMSLGHAREVLGKDKIIGVTAKTVQQAQEAEQAGADYLGSGAVFGSTTKEDTSKLEIEVFRQICTAISIPVVAIGGITTEKVCQLEKTGMAGIAVVGAVFAAENIEKACRELKQQVEKIIG